MIGPSRSRALRAVLLAGALAIVSGAAALAGQPAAPGAPGGPVAGEVRGLNGGASPGTRLVAAPPPPPPEVGTSLSPPTSKRVTDRSSFSGTWDRYQRGNPAPPTPPPAAGPPPVKPEIKAKIDAAQKALADAAARYEPIATDAVDCLPEGFPGMMNAIFPIEFLVTPGQVTIIEEAFNQVRRIYIDEPQGKIGDVEPVWFGHSVAKWEGDTLVIDTIGVKEQAKFRNIPHSDNMRITERMKLLSPDFLQDEMTIVDPEVFTEPWKLTFTYRRNPGYKIQEYICEAPRIYRDENGTTRLRTN